MRTAKLFRLSALFVLFLTLVVAQVVVWTGEDSARANDGTEAPAKPTGLRVATEPGSLGVSVDWNDVDGATSYWVRWRLFHPDHKLNEGVRLTGLSTDITVPSYGEWVVRVQACNGDTCGRAFGEEICARTRADTYARADTHPGADAFPDAYTPTHGGAGNTGQAHRTAS